MRCYFFLNEEEIKVEINNMRTMMIKDSSGIIKNLPFFLGFISNSPLHLMTTMLRTRLESTITNSNNESFFLSVSKVFCRTNNMLSRVSAREPMTLTLHCLLLCIPLHIAAEIELNAHFSSHNTTMTLNGLRTGSEFDDERCCFRLRKMACFIQL